MKEKGEKTVRAAKPHRDVGKTFLRTVEPYLFVAPFVFFFVLFGLVPLVMGIVISFTKWDYASPMEWYGLKNFGLLFGTVGSGQVAKTFWNGVLHTLLFAVVETPLLIFVPLGVALLVTKCRWVKKFSMGFFYFPTILSITTVCILFNFLLDTNSGVINHYLHAAIPWITQMPYAWISIFLLSTWWGVGGNMILYVAGIANVPQELLEAATLDGANAVQRFFRIVLPCMKRTMLYTLIMTTIGSFNMLGQSQVLTAGGPNYMTRTAMMVIYDTAFGGVNNFGRACAMSIVFGAIMFVFTFAGYRLQIADDKEEAA